MKVSQEMQLLIMALAALAIGALVLLFNPDYRVEYNLKSNVAYYAESTQDAAADFASPEEFSSPVDF
jgi:hypothetical protein